MSSEKVQKDISLQRNVSIQTKSSLVSQDYGKLSRHGSDHLQNNGYGMQVASSMGMTYPMIQPKLTVGQPNDKYEQEADNVAKSVVNKITNPSNDWTTSENINAISGNTQVSQRIMKMAGPDEISEPESDVEGKIESSRGRGSALPDSVKTPMENAFGADFSKVKIHTDNNSDKLNKTIQAKAFTTGSDIFFKSGEFKPESKEGQELVAHELTHVQQQTGAGPKSTVQRHVNTLTSSPLVIQRFEDDFKTDDADALTRYLTDALQEIKDYITNKDCGIIGSPTCRGARIKLNGLKTKLSKKNILTIKKNLITGKGVSSEVFGAIETLIIEVIKQIDIATLIKDNEVKKEKKVEKIDKSGRNFEEEIKNAGWDKFNKILGELGIESAEILHNFNVLLADTGGNDISPQFLKALFLTTEECYFLGYLRDLVDKKSFILHLLKLKDNSEKGAYSGILAELQALSILLDEKRIIEGKPVVMGEMRPRTLPFAGAHPKQDIDLQYEDEKGIAQYIEVKDRVSTLESKMNNLVGKAKLDDQPFEENDSRQITSLLKIVNDDYDQGKHSSLTVACISPYGWVRFITGDHCLQLIKYNVSFKIASVLYSPSDLTILRGYVENILSKEYDPMWKENSKNEKLPIITPSPVGNRHQSAWEYEEKQKFPPTIDEIKKDGKKEETKSKEVPVENDNAASTEKKEIVN
ncbi:DUF4157 domain-containing protein [Sporocytophaga myxococcoides]|uniref:eCIS core domain-containing protein n=1 Tax=Sporocytophaga myxococcoides TaxID=153721 RepID=UPI000404DA98|nr:DUF4157 domain-containing protein [Sporocytophaga myxococcoides]